MIKVLLKPIDKVTCLKAVCSADVKVARQGLLDNTTLRAVAELFLVMSEEPHVSVHNLLPDMRVYFI